MLAQLERCYKGQAHAHEIPAPDVPRGTETLTGTIECLPEEPMGNQAPPVPESVEWPPYDTSFGYWA